MYSIDYKTEKLCINHKHERNKLVAKYFKDTHQENNDFYTKALDREMDKNKRLRLGESWIYLRNTLHPNGLNNKVSK